MSLLPKGNKNTKYIRNLRALTILNYDYKILAKLMDNRIREVLDKLIHPDQTGFIKGRHISTNVRKSLDVIEYCGKNKIPAMILSIDMEKCFDRIDYSAVTGALKYFNFGPNFIKWTSLFFTNFEVCTQNHGHRSRYFRKERSINQGCPFSPSVYLLISEIIANKLRNHDEIQGINIGKVELLLSMFADDMDLYLPYKQTVLNAVLRSLTLMEINLGIKVSYEKTKLYRIGSLANSDARLYTLRPLQWTSGSINTLGINLYNSNKEMVQNYDSILCRMKAVMETWYYRTLTLMGKVLIINSLCSSLFVYKMQVAPQLSEKMLAELDVLTKSFLWNNKKSKIKLEILRKPKSAGGLGLVDFRAKHTALLVNWVSRIRSNPILHELAAYFIGNHVENDMIWKYNLSPKDVHLVCKTQAGFWFDLVSAWCTLNSHFAQNKENVLNQCINYNSNIRKGATLFNHPAFKNRKIKDIMDEESNFLPHNQFCATFDTSISWLEYAAVINAIPGFWKFALKSDDLIDCFVSRYELWCGEKNGDMETNCKSISKLVYLSIVEDDQAIVSSGRSWHKILGDHYNHHAHEKAFRAIYQVTNVIKLRNFQFRLLHNKIFCNNILFHWKKVPSQECEFCVEPKQDVSHLLWYCISATRVWEGVCKWMDEIVIVNIGNVLCWNLENIVYNSVHPKPSHVINFLILIVKFYIFRCKCESKNPNMYELKQELLLYYDIEQYNAYRNNRELKHKLKWKDIKFQEETGSSSHAH